MGVHPSYVVHVRRGIWDEVDGPMMRKWLEGVGFWVLVV